VEKLILAWSMEKATTKLLPMTRLEDLKPKYAFRGDLVFGLRSGCYRLTINMVAGESFTALIIIQDKHINV
jgi:hypothetical protein